MKGGWLMSRSISIKGRPTCVATGGSGLEDEELPMT